MSIVKEVKVDNSADGVPFIWFGNFKSRIHTFFIQIIFIFTLIINLTHGKSAILIGILFELDEVVFKSLVTEVSKCCRTTLLNYNVIEVVENQAFIDAEIAKR
ncbi:hypothetical protein L9F63_017959, partial [Diploptera punctata]